MDLKKIEAISEEINSEIVNLQTEMTLYLKKWNKRAGRRARGRMRRLETLFRRYKKATAAMDAVPKN